MMLINSQEVLANLKRDLKMTTELFGTEFVTTQTPRFNSAFKGESTQRKDVIGSIMARRTIRRDRRANRAL